MFISGVLNIGIFPLVIFQPRRSFASISSARISSGSWLQWLGMSPSIFHQWNHHLLLGERWGTYLNPGFSLIPSLFKIVRYSYVFLANLLLPWFRIHKISFNIHDQWLGHWNYLRINCWLIKLFHLIQLHLPVHTPKCTAIIIIFFCPLWHFKKNIFTKYKAYYSSLKWINCTQIFFRI